MSQPQVVEAGQSTDEEPLQNVYDQAMKLFDKIEKSTDPTNSDPAQISIKAAITKFEKATNIVSMTGMFSRNESLEELPTETLQYLLLPALLGTLTLKRCGPPRMEIINIAEIYFRDFLQRCKDYGVTDIELPQPSTTPTIDRVVTEQAKIANVVMTRDAKIKRYLEMKAAKEKLNTLSQAMARDTVDDETKREYFLTLLRSYINEALDELSSIEREKPLLDYMERHGGEPQPKAPRSAPLKPVIITRDALQKAVYGAGYPALPTLTVQEFYDSRVRAGVFPKSGTNITHTTIENAEEENDDVDRIRKELLEEQENEEELARKRAMDEYKDDHRTGWGNRYNRS